MSLLDKLKADYAARRVPVEVLDETVFVTPLTVAEQLRVNAKYPNDTASQMIESLIIKCRDADGQPVFTKDDDQELKRAVAGDRLSAAIAAITGPGAKALVKK